MPGARSPLDPFPVDGVTVVATVYISGGVPINTHDRMGEWEASYRIWCKGISELTVGIRKEYWIAGDIDSPSDGGADCEEGGSGSGSKLTRDCCMAAML